MKKICQLIALLLITVNVNSQSYIGFLTDNYSGVHGVINNPANIADSKYKIDINLAGGSALFGNDYYGITPTRLLDENYSLRNDASRFPKEQNNIYGNIDVLGPSVLININKKSAFAFFTRYRSFYNITNFNGTELDKIQNGFDENQAFTANLNNTFITTNNWAEIGFTYSSILIQENQHFVKGGFTFKYLKGLGNAYAVTNDFNIDYDPDEIAESSNTLGSISSDGELSYGFSENFRDNTNDVGPVSGAGALGLDVGLVYEWRPNEQFRKYSGFNKYKVKVGLSVTDIGSITYDHIEERYNLDNTVTSQANFESIQSAEDFRKFYSIESTGQTEKAVLPTAFHFNADWNINQKFYLNFNTDLSLTKKTKANRSHSVNMYSITPRYESKWLTLQTPISIQQYSGFQWGAGFRAGPIYVGSGSAITSLFKKDTKALDIYAGIKIPFFQPKSKDKDKDGVPDKVDRCKDEFGAIDNNGCPWEDTDGDGLTDNLDDCPKIPGDIDNNGCPQLTHEIQEALNAEAEIIFFNSNKTEITPETNDALMKVIDILNEYPYAQLSIEGHADSIGNSKLNQKVSELRANAVRNFLIQKGIEPSRLTAVGYGENKPIATNLTRKGRAENRRVEIKLIQP